MPVTIPAGVMLLARLEGPEEVRKLEEWCLSSEDVRRLTGASSLMTITNWGTRGKKGWKLPRRRFGVAGRGGAYAYRLQDVEVFCAHFGWRPNYESLPDYLQRRYRVGRYEGLEHDEPGEVKPA